MISWKETWGFGWRKSREVQQLSHCPYQGLEAYTAQVPFPMAWPRMFTGLASIYHTGTGSSTLSLRSQMRITSSWRNICICLGLPWAEGTSITPREVCLWEQLWQDTAQEYGEPAGSFASLVCFMVRNSRNVWAWSGQKEEGCFCWNVWGFIHFL